MSKLRLARRNWTFQYSILVRSNQVICMRSSSSLIFFSGYERVPASFFGQPQCVSNFVSHFCSSFISYTKKAARKVLFCWRLHGGQKNCFILFDEVYIKPSIRYRGGHLIDYSVDKPTLPARTLLAFMLKPCFGGLAFVCRLFPIHSLSPFIVTQNLNEIISCVAENEGRKNYRITVCSQQKEKLMYIVKKQEISSNHNIFFHRC